ncbi:MAG: flagellar FliJ family protein [Planctomycetia bacterium]|nr:flagellar FliJ family protein [Planctomycetia bacterium]
MSFQFRLASVAQVRKSVRDEKRISLKEILTREADLSTEMASLQLRWETLRDQKEALFQKNILPIQSLQQLHQCEQKLLEKINQIQKQLEEIHQFAEEKRKALVAADQNVKTLEKLEEKQRACYLQKIRRKAG